MVCEIVVYTIEAALNAQTGGADRIELCDGPGDGGTTPAYGVIEVVRQNLSIDVFVMIRPRGGDFLYSNDEYHAMKRDIAQCQRLSADGVVLGILNPDGTMDKKRCKELIDQARPMKVTCHRAFDMTRDPFEALEDCIEVGFDRILTSGQRATASEGKELIAALQERAAGRIAIMAGSGVNETTVVDLVRTTQVKEIHFSATAYREGGMQFKNEHIAGMGANEGAEYKLRIADPEKIKMIRAMATEQIKEA